MDNDCVTPADLVRFDLGEEKYLEILHAIEESRSVKIPKIGIVSFECQMYYRQMVVERTGQRAVSAYVRGTDELQQLWTNILFLMQNNGKVPGFGRGDCWSYVLPQYQGKPRRSRGELQEVEKRPR